MIIYIISTDQPKPYRGFHGMLQLIIRNTIKILLNDITVLPLWTDQFTLKNII
jgi:hypothetical protein